MIRQLINFAEDAVDPLQLHVVPNLPQASVNQAQVNSIFNGILAVAGAVAVVFIVLGGIKYSTSQGDPGDTKKAKDMIMYALVGLVVVILAFAIVQLFTGSVF